MRIICCVVAVHLLLVAAAPAGATSVHKCGLADGRIVYQSGECGRGERMLARWDAVPDPPSAQSPRSRTASPERPARSGSSVRRRSTRSSAAAVDACGEAKQRRDAAERRAGLSRTYDFLSALQRDVYDACK